MTDAISVILVRNNKFALIEKIPESEFYPCFWAPPHAHIKEGETEEQAVIRVCKEHLGVDVIPVKRIKTTLTDYSGSNLYWWLADTDQKIERQQTRNLKVGWYSWSECMKKQLLPATQAVFRSDLREMVLSNLKVKGKFIALDGIDASGKKEHTKRLREWLEEQGFIVSQLAFPMYETPFGKLVGQYLKGDFGTLEEVPIESANLLYAADRYAQAMSIRKRILNGEWVVADRYTTSNIGFQAGKYKVWEEADKFADWIEVVESRMPQPDIVIILKQDAAIARKWHEQRKLENYMGRMKLDIHDADLEYQQRVMEMYLRVAKKKSNWFVVDVIRDGQIRDIDEIQEEIRKVVEKELLAGKQPKDLLTDVVK